MTSKLKSKPGFWADLVELTKPGICFLAIVMAGFGFFLVVLEEFLSFPSSECFWAGASRRLFGDSQSVYRARY